MNFLLQALVQIASNSLHERTKQKIVSVLSLLSDKCHDVFTDEGKLEFFIRPTENM